MIFNQPNTVKNDKNHFTITILINLLLGLSNKTTNQCSTLLEGKSFSNMVTMLCWSWILCFVLKHSFKVTLRITNKFRSTQLRMSIWSTKQYISLNFMINSCSYIGVKLPEVSFSYVLLSIKINITRLLLRFQYLSIQLFLQRIRTHMIYRLTNCKNIQTLCSFIFSCLRWS